MYLTGTHQRVLNESNPRPEKKSTIDTSEYDGFVSFDILFVDIGYDYEISTIP